MVEIVNFSSLFSSHFLFSILSLFSPPLQFLILLHLSYPILTTPSRSSIPFISISSHEVFSISPHPLLCSAQPTYQIITFHLPAPPPSQAPSPSLDKCTWSILEAYLPLYICSSEIYFIATNFCVCRCSDKNTTPNFPFPGGIVYLWNF